MGQSAIGMTEEQVNDAAQKVPDEVRSVCCSVCLWAGCECRKGSLLNLNETEDFCDAYSYYD